MVEVVKEDEDIGDVDMGEVVIGGVVIRDKIVGELVEAKDVVD